MEKLKQFEFGAVAEIKPVKNLLYHYTNSDGLFGITTSGTLWASRIQFLNDEKEFIHAVDVAKNELQRRKDIEGTSVDEQFLYEILYSRVESMQGANTYIVSLSEEPDLLSQWRAYGGKGGYSIGFCFDELLAISQRQSFRLLKCIYEIEEQKSLINCLIDHVLTDFLKDPTANKGSKGMQEIQGAFYSQFLLMAGTMKHHSFQEEREWRLIGGPFRFTNPNTKWRPKESMLFPYYVFDLSGNDRYSIDNIFIGPNNQAQLARDSANQFIQSLKKGWSTNYSESTYRIEK